MQWKNIFFSDGDKNHSADTDPGLHRHNIRLRS